MRLSRLRWQSYRPFTTSRSTENASESFALPTARLRALISLYHQSSTFITPANLSDRIDLAFANPLHIGTLAITEYSHAKLEAQVNSKKDQSRVGPPSVSFRGISLEREGTFWSDRRGVRQGQVGAALWGSDLYDKPGLEVIQETSRAEEELSNRLAEADNHRDP